MRCGLLQALSPGVLPYLGLGALFGPVVGVIPGLSGHFAMAMTVTLLHATEPATGIAFILAAHAAVAQGGGLTAILFSNSGAGQNAATLPGGPRMRDRGQAGVAVGAAMTACFLGAAFGALVPAALIPVPREAALLFGPPEIFALAVLGLVFVAVLGKRDLARSLIAAIPGLFAVAETIALWRRGGSLARGAAGRMLSRAETQTQIWRGAGLAFRHWRQVLRPSTIGAAIGAIPGLGSSVAAFLVWGHARQISATPETFGTGNVEGVIAPEAANDAVEGGAPAATVAFGAPGAARASTASQGWSRRRRGAGADCGALFRALGLCAFGWSAGARATRGFPAPRPARTSPACRPVPAPPGAPKRRCRGAATFCFAARATAASSG